MGTRREGYRTRRLQRPLLPGGQTFAPPVSPIASSAPMHATTGHGTHQEFEHQQELHLNGPESHRSPFRRRYTGHDVPPQPCAEPHGQSMSSYRSWLSRRPSRDPLPEGVRESAKSVQAQGGKETLLEAKHVPFLDRVSSRIPVRQIRGTHPAMKPDH